MKLMTVQSIMSKCNIPHWLGRMVSLLCLGLANYPAYATDPFHVQQEVPDTPGSPILGSHVPCAMGMPGSHLTFSEAIERALCANPDTRAAWVAIEAAAAVVGISKGAYLPTLSGNGQWAHDDSVTRVLGHPELSSNDSTVEHFEELTLGLVLYDFGGRRAALNSAEAQLAAAQANEEVVLQQTFAATAQAYYAAQAAHEQLYADEAIVIDAKSSLTAAQDRVSRGIAPNTEVYQAQTSYLQAMLAQNHDQGQLQAAQGNLANIVAPPRYSPGVGSAGRYSRFWRFLSERCLATDSDSRERSSGYFSSQGAT